jgi:hypothetical protein
VTISTSNTFTFTIGQIVTMAYRDAALISMYESPTLRQTQAALDEFERIVNGTQAKGLFARTIDFYNLTPLVLNQFVYPATLNVLDVVGVGMYIDPTQADITRSSSETQVLPMSRETWQELSGKGAQGRPTMYYPHRVSDQLQIYLWPLPSAAEAGGTIRFQIHRYRADVRDPNATTDFERFWVDWLTSELATRLALMSGVSMERVQTLQALAISKLRDCRAMATQRVSQQFVARHRTGYR